MAASLLLGSLRGVCTSGISLVWIALFVYRTTCDLPVLYMATFALSSLAGLAMRAVTSERASLTLTILLLLASLACCRALLSPTDDNAPQAPRAPGLIHLRSDQGWAFYASWLCLLVCEFVVGVTNTAVFNSDFSAAMTGVNMSLCMLVAVGLLALLFAALRKTPDPTAVFKGCMPVMLAVFSVMALMADQLGPLSGSTMIVCYDMLALAFSIYLVTFLRDHGYNPYLNAGVFVGVSNLTLLLGLSIGVALNALWSSQGVPLLTLLAFVAIYPVGLALLLCRRPTATATSPHPRPTPLCQHPPPPASRSRAITPPPRPTLPAPTASRRARPRSARCSCAGVRSSSPPRNSASPKTPPGPTSRTSTPNAA